MLFEYHELSIYRNIHLSICSIGSFLHSLNYTIKVSVERLTHCHVRCFCVSNSNAMHGIGQT